MKPETLSLIRSALKVVGTYLVTKGLIDEGTVETIIGGLLALLGVVWGYMRAKPPGPVSGAGLVLLVPLILIPGCARFSTQQTDTSYATNGIPQRAITTKATAYTVFSATSELAKFKASQTDKTQSATVGTLSQTATEPTNTLNTVEAIAGAVVTAAIKAAK
jgi:hypothetical protein